MKIFHVNMAGSGGGLEQYLMQLFRELKSRGHNNYFLFGERNGKEKFISCDEIYAIDHITHLECPNLKVKIKNLSRILKRVDPDIIYIHQVLNSELIKLLTLSKPTVRFVHGFKLICPEGTKILKSKNIICSKSLGYLCQFNAFTNRCMPRNLSKGLPLIFKAKKNVKFHKYYSAMVVASHYMKLALLENRFNENRIIVNPYFTYLPDIKNENKISDVPLILALGRLVQAKGMHHLLKAVSLVKEDFNLIIAGDGPELKNLKKIAAKLNLLSKITFSGWVPHHRLDELYRKCDVLVVPSIWPEPFGIVGIEAMAYQKPVIAFNVGGVSDWCIDGKTGFLVEPGNEKELATKIGSLLTNKNLAIKLGIHGRQIVKKRFLPNNHIDTLINIFDEEISKLE